MGGTGGAGAGAGAGGGAGAGAAPAVQQQFGDDGKTKTIRVSNLTASVTSNLGKLMMVFGQYGPIMNTSVRPELHCVFLEYAQRSSALAAASFKGHWPLPQLKTKPRACPCVRACACVRGACECALGFACRAPLRLSQAPRP